ncbi:hypothetical protein [Halobellus sp. GM3]|uniref:hypothetical protein n=1 Tax=Halobellus sp. GM3 TaxID=3458410 RepID=UPI00403DF025
MQRSIDRERDDAGSPSTAERERDRTDAGEATRRGSLRGALPSKPTFSIRSFLLVLALSVVGVVAGGSIPLVGSVGQFVGLFVVAFGVGAVGSRRRYLEIGLAGAVAAGLAFVLGTLTSVFAPVALRILADYGIAIAGVGTGAGALASLAGYYFGRDLRDGLTRDVR